jgi:hypothetical protein
MDLGNTPKPPPIYVSDVATIPPITQLLEQIAKLQYEIKALAANQIKIQPKTSKSYRQITKALAEKHMAFHTYKPKEQKYRAVQKNMHYLINPAEIKSEIEKLGHTVTNIWNIKQDGNKLSLPTFFCRAKTCSEQQAHIQRRIHTTM